MIVELNYEARGWWAKSDYIARFLVKEGARCLRVREIEPDYEAPEGCSKDAKSFAAQIEWPVSGPLGPFEELRKAVWVACNDSFQDCAAVYIPAEDKGYLIGPEAKKWGEFNKEYFVRP